MSKINHLVIVAGGQGVRLASVVGDVPKALVPIGGKPVLQHQLELAAACGIQEATILAGHLGDKIATFVGDGSRFGLKARVLIEAKPMGNAGALIEVLDTFPEHFLVLFGDVMLAVDLQRMANQHLERHADLTVLVHPNDHPHDSDLVETDLNEWVTAIHAYPHPQDRFYRNLVTAGLYLMRREALRPWANATGKVDLTKGIISGLLGAGGRVLAYSSVEYIKDMGTPARLQKVEADWQAGKISISESRRPKPTVFLDRDGTLNIEKGHLRRHEDLELFPGVGAALKLLRQSGFYLVVLTNQPVIARGEATKEDVAAIHRRLEWELGKDGAYIDAIYFCPHHPDRGFEGERPELKVKCECRKPGIGLFEQACKDLAIDAAGSWMIGDQSRDIEMAKRAGLRSILVTNGTDPAVTDSDTRVSPAPDYVADTLASAARVVVERKGPLTR